MSEVQILEDVVNSTHVVGVVGERGVGKSWLLTLLSEIAAMSGTWHNIVYDTKGDDILRDQPAQGWQANVLKAMGLEPRGWNVKYYTFNFPYGLSSPPLKFHLAPIALKMIGFGHLKLLSSILNAMEQRLLIDALFSAGWENAKIEDVIKRILIKKKEKVSATLLALVTSGFFDNSSPLEAPNLLSEAENFDYTVINTSFFEASSINLARFGLLILLDNIKHYLRSIQSSHTLIFIFRELGEIAGRVGMVGTGWHLGQHVIEFVRTARQTGFSVTKVFYEAQSVVDVPPPLLSNTHVLFVHPVNLKQGKQLKEVKKYWEMPESFLRSVAALENARPGLFYVLRKDGSWDILNSPPPLSMMIREYVDKREAEKEAELVENLLPKWDISELRDHAIRRMGFWRIQAAELSEEDVFQLMDPEELSREFRSVRVNKGMAVLLLAMWGHIVAHSNGEEFMQIRRKDLVHWLYQTWRKQNPDLPPHKTPSHLIAPVNLKYYLRANKKLLTLAGIKWGKLANNDLAFVVNTRRFMALWEELGPKLAEEYNFDKEFGIKDVRRGFDLYGEA